MRRYALHIKAVLRRPVEPGLATVIAVMNDRMRPTPRERRVKLGSQMRFHRPTHDADRLTCLAIVRHE